MGAMPPSPFYAVLYFDYVLISGRKPGVVTRLKKAFTGRSTMTDTGEISLIPGMTATINYGEGTFTIT